MSTEYTIKTANGHDVKAICWASDKLNFQIIIDGELYTDGTSHIGKGDTIETEAKHQATQTAEDIDSGRVALQNGSWKMIERDVIVSDVGSSSRFFVGGDGAITVVNSGGVPVADLLAGKIGPRMTAQELADSILDAWRSGYFGDPAANGLRVEVDYMILAVA